jgi:hypothetical protein
MAVLIAAINSTSRTGGKNGPLIAENICFLRVQTIFKICFDDRNAIFRRIKPI